MLAEANQSAQTKVVLQFLQFDRKTHWQHYYLVQTVVANLLRINRNRVSTLYVCSIFLGGVSSILFSQNNYTKTRHVFLYTIYQSTNIYKYITYVYISVLEYVCHTNLCFSPFLTLIHSQTKTLKHQHQNTKTHTKKHQAKVLAYNI